MSRVKEHKKYLKDVVVRGRQNLFLFRLRRNFFLLEKNSKWNDYHSFKEKHWFFYWTRTRHLSQNLKNTLTMLSSEVDRICSSSVWDETFFCWNKKTVNEVFFKLKYIFPLEENVSRVTELKKYLNDVVSRSRENSLLFRLGWDFFLLEHKDNKWNDYHSFKDKHIFLLDENMSRVRELKKYLHDVVVRGRQNLFLFRLGRNFFLLEQKDSKWIDYHSFKDKHIFLLDKNVSRVKELNNTLTMLSSEDDKVCSSSVWEETSFCWNRKTVNELIIIHL